MATPNAMPRKTNPLHLAILGALTKIGQTTRTEIRTKFDKKSQSYVDHKVKVPVPLLAGNVSELNVDRAARRWI